MKSSRLLIEASKVDGLLAGVIGTIESKTDPVDAVCNRELNDDADDNDDDDNDDDARDAKLLRCTLCRASDPSSGLIASNPATKRLVSALSKK